ncbi:hypothetical protein SKAU_G00316590 [Synaphobranchus kaupii]|uniref:Uncharacterized protein n=1 Tax=Synaphobranchus kaupii TaxID=118154 RepID=A0A9Q1ESQ0_SYNKA|nr:hypothetical protein SKAU_G00316590 [Synaphobranchus kaupii]
MQPTVSGDRASGKVEARIFSPGKSRPLQDLDISIDNTTTAILGQRPLLGQRRREADLQLIGWNDSCG